MAEREKLLAKMPLPRWYGMVEYDGLRGFVLDTLLALDVLPKNSGGGSHQELEITTLKQRIVRLEAGMRCFADQHNWHDNQGSLQWASMRSPIEIAEEAIRD